MDWPSVTKRGRPEAPLLSGNESSKKKTRQDRFSRLVSKEEQITLHSKKRKAVQGRFLDVDADFKPPDHPKSEHDARFLDDALGGNFIFAGLSVKERYLLIKALQKQEFPKGEVIIKQGQVGDFFYICESGTVKFVADGEDVGSCGKGGSFGELALLYDSPRAATCIAENSCILWKVDQHTFKMLLARTSRAEESNIEEILVKIDLFQGLDKGLISKFASVLSTVTFTEGELIVEKGEKGDIFYIIKEGQVRVHDIGVGDSSYVDQVLEAGDWYGERALMLEDVRAANVTAMTDVQALAVDRKTFESTIGPLESILGMEAKKRFIKSVPIFSESEFLPSEYDQLESLMTETKYEKGTKLAEAGKPGHQCLWIVKAGKLIVTDSSGKIFILGSAGYFGDKTMYKNSSSTYISEATCVCEEDTTCWNLKLEDIKSVIGNIQRLGNPIPFVPASRGSVDLKDVIKHKLLGKGAFGKVWQCSTKSCDTAYALKVIDKRRLIQAKQVKGVIRERQIMSCIHHHFILGLVGSYQDDRNLYFLLPQIQGGELFSVIHKEGKHGISDEAAIFYGACIVEALGYLHARNIVYRDMKPENALIDHKGYCILIDLGFAKIVVDKTYTLCGTPEYIAPEIILSKGHNKAVDYWSFGVLIYEMMVGRSPFSVNGTNQVALLKSIVRGAYSCPDTMNVASKDLITRLLITRQTRRLGNLSRGCLDVREHIWFKSLNFNQLNSREADAPWVPLAQDLQDLSQFGECSQEDESSYTLPPLRSGEQNYFAEF